MRASLGIGRMVALLGLVLVVAGCTTTFRNHGLVPRDDVIAQITPGKDTRETVAELIGTPAMEPLRRKDAWYYVESRFRHRAFAAPVEIDRKVLVVTFSSAGTVTDVARYGLENGQIVRLVARTTPFGPVDQGLLGELLGVGPKGDPTLLIN